MFQTLSDFQYIDSSGRDQGNNVRRKSQSLVVLVNDKERVYELRQKGAASRDKDEDRYGNGKEKEWGSKDDDRYNRDRDSYGREGDRSSVYSDERYGRDGSRDDDSRGGHGNDDYQDGSRNRSIEDDDRYSSRFAISVRTGISISDRYGMAAPRPRGKTSPSWKMRRCQRENEVLPHPNAGRLGGALSLSWKIRRHLAFQRENKTLSHPRTGRRGSALVPA
ncbi:hypothetical protein BHE74_00052939 [Ensete ventricosum]|nr:hypothetical protein BHE74_00052939 [Ensete ventricosum]